MIFSAIKSFLAAIAAFFGWRRQRDTLEAGAAIAEAEAARERDRIRKRANEIDQEPPIILTTLLTGCSIPVTAMIDCAWAKPIRFSEETKAWLHTFYDDHGRPLPMTPETLAADLAKVAKHNEKYEEFCR